VKKRFSLTLSLFCAIGLSAPGVPSAIAQGMVSAPSAAGSISNADLGGLADIGAEEVSTIQRLLRRLGYLKDENMTRQMDAATTAAIVAHIQKTNAAFDDITAEGIMRSLFTAAWTKEGWASGSANGQNLVVEPAEVRQAQDALKRLKYAPGPSDGVFGPATLSAIELFQEDNGMKVTGLLTRNTFQNVTRALNFVDKEPINTVRMLNWADYINPTALDNFEKKTGIRVVHEVFTNSTETKNLLLQGSNKYDLMVQAGAQMRQVLEEQSAVETLDRAKLPNAGFLDPAALKYTGVLDPGNAHSVPYLWGTVGLAVNKEKVRKIRPDLAFDSMGLILDPAIAADLSKCGIAIIDEPIDVIPAFVAYLGGDTKNIGITDLEAVDAALAKVSPYIKVVSVDSYIDSIASGKYCVTWGYSGAILYARDLAKKKNTGTINYYVPKEGSELWFDLFVIPNQSQNKDGAYQLLNYLLKPEVAASNTNFLKYANPITESAKFIEPNLLGDPSLYPPKSILKRLSVQPPMPANIEAELKRIWSKLSKE
jgi:putrescine transport system substrate-binding protein